MHTWKCRRCEAVNTKEFHNCWNCGRDPQERPASPQVTLHSSSDRPRDRHWGRAAVAEAVQRIP